MQEIRLSIIKEILEQKRSVSDTALKIVEDYFPSDGYSNGDDARAMVEVHLAFHMNTSESLKDHVNALDERNSGLTLYLTPDCVQISADDFKTILKRLQYTINNIVKVRSVINRHFKLLSPCTLDNNYLFNSPGTINFWGELRQKINLLDSSGKGILHYAVEMADLCVIALLIYYGAKVNLKTSLGETPLFIATQNEELKIVELLMAEGADPEMSDQMGVSCFDLINQKLEQYKDKNKNNEQTAPPKKITAMQTYLIFNQLPSEEKLKIRPVNKGFAKISTLSKLWRQEFINLKMTESFSCKEDEWQIYKKVKWVERNIFLYLNKFGNVVENEEERRNLVDFIRKVEELNLGWKAIVNFILCSEKITVNSIFSEGYTFLHFFIFVQKIEAINYLFTQGADITIMNQKGEKPIDMIAKLGLDRSSRNYYLKLLILHKDIDNFIEYCSRLLDCVEEDDKGFFELILAEFKQRVIDNDLDLEESNPDISILTCYQRDFLDISY